MWGQYRKNFVGLVIIIDYMFMIPGVLKFSDRLKIITLDKTPIGFVMIFLLGMITAAFLG